MDHRRGVGESFSLEEQRWADQLYPSLLQILRRLGLSSVVHYGQCITVAEI